MAYLLIVEDDPLVRRSLLRALHGHTCVGAVNGIEALQALSTRTFDLVITDVDMPHMNGIDLYYRVRELFPGLRVIFRTGSKVSGLAALGAPVLPKDWPLSEVRRAVDTYVRLGVLPMNGGQSEAVLEMGGR